MESATAIAPSPTGSAAAEVAVCLKSVGMALRPELRTLELTGREAWLENLLERALGSGPPSPGRLHGVADTWCARIDAHRALIVGAQGAVDRWLRVAREALVTGSAIGFSDASREHAAVSLIGPRAGELIERTGLPEVPVGSAQPCSLAGAEAVVLRQAPDQVLLLLGADGFAAAWRTLMEAGPPVGLSLVGTEAIARLAAAPVGAASRRPPTGPA